jgi:hypothetical protein
LPEYLRGRVTKSIVELSEETCTSIGYHLNDVMRHNVYFKRLTPEMKLKQVYDTIYDAISQGLSSAESASSPSQNTQLPRFVQDVFSSEKTNPY